MKLNSTRSEIATLYQCGSGAGACETARPRWPTLESVCDHRQVWTVG